MAGKKISKKRFEEVKQFFNRKSIYRQLKSLALGFVSGKNKEIKLILNDAGQNYTDGKTVVVSLFDFAYDCSFSEIFSILKACVGHEVAHVLYSNFKYIKTFREDASVYLETKHNVPGRFAKQLASHLHNSLEDGRIERIHATRYRGILKHFKFLRMIWWENMEVTAEDAPYMLWSSAILTLATTGMWPKGYEVEGNEEVTELVESLIPHIHNAIFANDALTLNKEAFEIIKKSGDFLEKCFENELSDEEQEALENFLSQMASSMEHQSGEMSDRQMERLKEDLDELDEDEMELPHSTQTVSKPSQRQSHNQDSSSSNSSDSQDHNDDSQDEQSSETDESKGDENKDDNNDNNSSSSSSSNGDEQDEDKDNQSSSQSSQTKSDKDEKDNTDNTSSPNSSTKGEDDNEEDSNKTKDSDNTEKSDELDDSNESNDSNDSKDSKDSQDSESEKAKNNHQSNSTQEEDEKREQMKKDIQEALEKHQAEAKKFLEEVMDDLKKDLDRADAQERKIEADERKQTIEDDVQIDAGKFCELNGYKYDFKENYFAASHVNVSSEIKRRARMLRQKIERLLFVEEHSKANRYSSGRLNASKLWRLKIEESDVFYKKANEAKDYCATLLIDVSGSMDSYTPGGTRYSDALLAASVIEEALRDLVPFNIILFTTYGQDIVHYNIKGFKGSKFNHCQSFYQEHSSAFQANNDAVSIAIAAEKLTKRPEQEKILFVISDGQPAHYGCSGAEGVVLTKQSVDNARAKGVEVIGIAIGDESHLSANADIYKTIYGKSLVLTPTEKIATTLGTLLGTILK